MPIRYSLEIFKKSHKTKKNHENDAIFYLRKVLLTFSNKYIINRNNMDSKVVHFDTKHMDTVEVKYDCSQDKRDLLR